MRTLLFLLFIVIASVANNALASEGSEHDTLMALQKEVQQIFRKNGALHSSLALNEDEHVTVGFMINAKSEIIILDVNGENSVACDYVKQVLNYQQLKFDQARQLTRYVITIHLVKENT